MTDTLARGIDELRGSIADILVRAAHGDWPLDQARLELERLAAAVEALAAGETAVRRAREAEAAHMATIMEVLYGLASLDFSRRAPIHGETMFDGLAAVANMLAEELEAAHLAMAEARAAAESATLAKSRFLAQMSHEVRTPLTALLGFADLLAAPGLSESERLNYAMIIRRNGEHLLAVINDILDLSKIEAGKLQLELIDCSPAQILGDVASLMRVRATESGLGFQLRAETPIPAVVRSDPTRLRQVLLNLTSNAVKFTERGRIEVSVRYLPAASRLEVAVKDTGIGMTPPQIAQLFRPFEQADLSMSRRFGGSGLGLVICKAVADALGGSIAVESETGRGSTFTLSLEVTVPAGVPFVDSLDGVRHALPELRPATRFAGTVLLAEDGPDNQVLVTTVLRQLGLTVGVVENGQLAIEHTLNAWRSGSPYDVVLMDMQMPIVDGYQATHRLRREGYRGPILALTAHAMAGERERCLSAGCDGYIRKPIDRLELVASLGAHLARAPSPAPGEPDVTSHFADDPDMAEVVARFVEGLPARGQAMRTAAHDADRATLLRLVHQLKGAAGGYGFPSITEAATRLEAALADAGAGGEAERLFGELLALCARARVRP